jgi:hypothetical protein
VRVSGTLANAILEAMRDNRTHGLPLTDEARVGIIRRVFEDTQWGPKRSNAWIARHVGETDRDLVERVRAEYLRDHGLQDPEKREVERGGKVYEQKVPRRPKADDDRGPDDAQDDRMPVGEDPPPEQRGVSPEDRDRQERIDREYLEAIPCRALIHAAALPLFDRMALGFRDASPILGSIRRWCAAHKPADGSWADPFFAILDRVGHMPVPLPSGDQKGWVACSKCRDEEGKATGKLEDGTVCPPCQGTGAKIPGLRI